MSCNIKSEYTILPKKSYEIIRKCGKCGCKTNYINTNNLVSKLRYPDYYYDKATGIKTGSTSQAGNCLVSSAKDGEKEFIAVVLNAESIKVSHNDSKAILQYGVKNFTSR